MITVAKSFTSSISFITKKIICYGLLANTKTNNICTKSNFNFLLDNVSFSVSRNSEENKYSKIRFLHFILARIAIKVALVVVNISRVGFKIPI